LAYFEKASGIVASALDEQKPDGEAVTPVFTFRKIR